VALLLLVLEALHLTLLPSSFSLGLPAAVCRLLSDDYSND